MLDKLQKKPKEESVITIAPNVNIFEQEKEIVLQLEMPGVDKKTLDVNLDRDRLTIRGQRKADEIGKEYTIIHQEREVVAFERAFELNTDVDHDKLSAEYNNGVLKVSLAKSEKALPKKIEIQS